MSHGKEAARDLRYGRRGGRWAAADPEERTVAEIRSDHLAKPPTGCACRWCTEADEDSPQLDMFGGEA